MEKILKFETEIKKFNFLEHSVKQELFPFAEDILIKLLIPVQTLSARG